VDESSDISDQAEGAIFAYIVGWCIASVCRRTN